jgi:uncharacterized protein
VRQIIFNLAIQSVGRALLLRDIMFGWAKINWGVDPTLKGVSRHWIRSGDHDLDAVLVRPAEERMRASVLICHGIGETVQRWFAVQQLLAAHGVASLVFDYSGYGRSRGSFDAKRAEGDAVAAFRFLAGNVDPMPISLLGFSLGSGVAAAMLPRVPACSLLLCAAFTSIRDAACSVGIPRWLGFGVPPIWRAEENLRGCTVPVLVVHGDRDRLFSVSMAEKLSACCGSPSRVIVVPNLTHNQPFSHPSMTYWGPVIEHLKLATSSAIEGCTSNMS